MSVRFASWALAGLAVTTPSAAAEGLRIVTSESFPAGTKETTEYIAADRSRVEERLISRIQDDRIQEHRSVHIRRCDLDKLILLDTNARTYFTSPLRGDLTSFERTALRLSRRVNESPAGQEIVVETTTVDTGERRSAFGHPARRVLTTRRQFPANDPAAGEQTVTDGWYIDLDNRLSCERTEGARGVLIAVPHREWDESHPPRVTFKDIGTIEKGFPIETTVSRSVAGERASVQVPPMTTHRIVTHLSRETLDPDLFEVPVGFRSLDRRFTRFADSWYRKAHIVRTVIGSWFR